MKDFVVVGHKASGGSMLIAVDSIEAIVPSGDGCRVYVTGHTYFDSDDDVGQVTAKLLDAPHPD